MKAVMSTLAWPSARAIRPSSPDLHSTHAVSCFTLAILNEPPQADYDNPADWEAGMALMILDAEFGPRLPTVVCPLAIQGMWIVGRACAALYLCGNPKKGYGELPHVSCADQA